MLVGLLAALFAWAVPVSAEPNADHASPRATLVRADIFWPAKGGPPAPATANCTDDDPSAYGETYALTGWTTEGLDGKAHLNVATVPSSVASSATSDLQAAFVAWSGASGASGAPAFTVVTDGAVRRETANRQVDVLFGRTPGSAIAVTYTWRWSDGKYESDIVLSNRLAWADIADDGTGCNESVVAYDFQGIATHEIGHLYGLGHPAGDRFATMYAYGYTGETLKRTLATSDTNGITTLY
jgi:hypothetical protein